MTQTFRIKNKFGEELDTLIEGNENASTTIIFVHGDLVNKNEKGNLLPDISKALNDKYRIVRFDYSGFGASDGKPEDCCYSKMAQDLDSVISFVKEKFNSKVSILAHSKGSFVTYLLSPINILKTIVTGPPNLPVTNGARRLKERLIEGDGIFDENGISSYTNDRGYVYKYGANWWRDIRNYDVGNITKYIKKSELILFKPMQDDIVGNDGFDDYKKLNLKFVELNGDHCFTKPEDKKVLIEKIKEFFENNLILPSA